MAIAQQGIQWELVDEDNVSLWLSESQLEQNTELEYPRHQITANITGSTFASSDIGKTFILLPGNGIMSNSNWSLTIGKPYTITQVDTGNNRVGFIDNNGAFIFLDDETTATGRQRGVDWEFSQEVPYGWTISNGRIDTDQLALGNIKGTGGAVSIIQTFDAPLAVGKYALKIGRPDTQNSDIRVTALNASGNTATVKWDDANADYADVTARENASLEVTEENTVFGIKLWTHHGARTIEDASLFLGEIAQGTIQVSTNSISKIAGPAGYNAGASTAEAIPSGTDGYFQFQYGGGGSASVGLVYIDNTFNRTNPPEDFRIQIQENGTVFQGTYNSGEGFLLPGAFVRIKHVASSNAVQFQKRQTVYLPDNEYVFPTEPTSGDNHVFDFEDRPLVRAIGTGSSLVDGELYRVHAINVTFGNANLYDIETNSSLGYKPSHRWQVVKEDIGYVTFFTSATTSQNQPLHFDASLFHTGTQINDVIINTGTFANNGSGTDSTSVNLEFVNRINTLESKVASLEDSLSSV